MWSRLKNTTSPDELRKPATNFFILEAVSMASILMLGKFTIKNLTSTKSKGNSW